MDTLKQKDLLQTEAQVSDELSAEDLKEISGGCPPHPPAPPNPIDRLRHWLNTNDGPNIARYIWPRR